MTINQTNDRKILAFANKSTAINTSADSFTECQRNIWILRYKLLTPLDPQILNIQRHLNHWYQSICHYRSLENTFLENVTLIKL